MASRCCLCLLRRPSSVIEAFECKLNHHLKFLDLQVGFVSDVLSHELAPQIFDHFVS